MNYFFCGIGGIGMSSVALWLAANGHRISGSDRGFDKGENTVLKTTLLKAGIQLCPQDGSGISDATDCLVVSSAVEESIPDVQEALQRKIPIQKRSQMLAQIFHSHPVRIAVGGTSGKTTITAMIGHILHETGKEPTVINGGIMLNNYGGEASNLLLGKGKICVIEADESDGSIDLYRPTVAVVSNISLDHKPIEELLPLFRKFAEKAETGAVLNADCPYTGRLRGKAPKTVTFSLTGRPADFIGEKITPFNGGMTFQMNGIDGSLAVPGMHNVADALAAIGAVALTGIDPMAALKALASYKGTKRRLEKIGTVHKITVYDDYAHNPEKIAASLSTVKAGSGRVFAIFQPHGFAPTRLMKDDLITAFVQHTDENDFLLFPEIFYQGGTVAKDISSADLVKALKAQKRAAFFFPKRPDIIPFITEHARPQDQVLIMGARDSSLTDFAKEILTVLGGQK